MTSDLSYHKYRKDDVFFWENAGWRVLSNKF